VIVLGIVYPVPSQGCLFQHRDFYYHKAKERYVICLGHQKWGFLSVDADVLLVDGQVGVSWKVKRKL